MSKTKNMKKALTLVLTFSMLFCLFGALGNVKAGAVTDRVSMYSSDVTFVKSGGVSRNVYVQTKDNASNQQVIVHYFYLDGVDWKDAQASYVTTLADGSKIWKASIHSFNTQYAIKYVADGETIWDNNNGKNYTNEDIGSAPIAVSRYGGYTYDDKYEIHAVLQDYAYQKNVQVRYTEDNWATYKDIPMSYQYTKEDGTEDWSVKLDVDKSKSDSFEYCIYYEVNGQTYWANNFGQNYDTSYRIYH